MELHRKAPRWSRTLTFECDDAFKGEVTDLSAVGMKVVCSKVKRAEPGERVLAGTLTFENGAHVRIKVKVARVVKQGPATEVGLSIAEADKSFYDALPRLRKDTGEHPVLED